MGCPVSALLIRPEAVADCASRFLNAVLSAPWPKGSRAVLASVATDLMAALDDYAALRNGEVNWEVFYPGLAGHCDNPRLAALDLAAREADEHGHALYAIIADRIGEDTARELLAGGAA